MYLYVRYSILVYNYVFGLVYVIFKELIYLCSILMILSYLLIIIIYFLDIVVFIVVDFEWIGGGDICYVII